MPRTFTSEDVLSAIWAECNKSSQKAVAERIGVSAPYLSDILLGKRPISDLVAEAFGFEKTVVTETLFRKKAAA